MSVTFKTIVATCALTAVAACTEQASEAQQAAADEPPAVATVSGTVAYRERIALSPEAELEVILEDVSRQDVAATVIAQKTIRNPGQVPIAFELEYDPAEIIEAMSYNLRARIHDGGRLRFISDTHNPVLTRGGGDRIDIMLVAVRPPAVQETASGVALTGQFRYMADAALFTDCASGKSYPVAMEGAYIELERAYMDSGIESGQPAVVALRGRFLERPAMEGNHNEVKLIVDSFEKLLPDDACVPNRQAELVGTYWKLIELNGETVTTPENMREAHFVLEAGESRLHGHGGCNNFFGGYSQADEDGLIFSGMGSTMMACPETMETEAAFMEAMGNTTRYRINGEILELYAGETLLARFEAVYL
jgi:uncharacterized lipoprotein YbaY/heat shock protein HslJ